MLLGRSALVMIVAVTLGAASAPAVAQSLDYEVFKTRVEPIFLKKRAGHVRCYVCHSESNNAFKLEKLPDGKSFWTEEQSRRNFEVVSKLVVPGNPDSSMLLVRPLAPEAGGHAYHSGGRQFATKNDPEWKIVAQWVNGQKQAARPAK